MKGRGVVDLFKLLEELEDVIQNSRRVPMTGKVMISEELLLEFVDQIRAALPEEMHQAKMVIRDRERMIEEGREKADRLLAQTTQKIEEMIRESEVVKQAQDAAVEIIAQGRRVALEIRNNAALYADEIMSALESTLEQNLSAVRRGREELNQTRKTGGVSG
jgi:vacuolar-type H+-ATPase subunit H